MPTPKPLTAPARLGLLLPWLNGDLDEHFYEGRNPEPVAVRTDHPAIRLAIAEFAASFDGSAEAGHVEVIDDPTPAELREPSAGPTDRDLDMLEAAIRILLEQGFATDDDSSVPLAVLDAPVRDQIVGTEANLTFPMSSLRFAVRGAGRQKPAKRGSASAGRPKTVAGGVTALRNYRAPGAYVLQVHGPMQDLVLFLVAHLLTAPNMASVKRCERRGCAHFVITATAKRGRPQRFCSAACREWNRELEQQRKRRRKK